MALYIRIFFRLGYGYLLQAQGVACISQEDETEKN